MPGSGTSSTLYPKLDRETYFLALPAAAGHVDEQHPKYRQQTLITMDLGVDHTIDLPVPIRMSEKP